MARIEMTPLKKFVLRMLLVYVVASLLLIGVKFVQAVGWQAPAVHTRATTH